MPDPIIPLWPAGVPMPDGVTPTETPALRPYLLADAAPRGAVIVCPGGGYGHRAPHESEPVARRLNAAGVHAFVLTYRVAPHRHPVPLLDAQRAIRLVRARATDWRVRPDRVGIIGFSAGGHLAATAATQFDAGQSDVADPVARAACRPDAAILCYPVISFGEHRHDGSMRNLLGPHPSDAARAELSNETRVTEDTPPCFLWHTADDGAVPVENSLLFAAALRRRRIPFALHVFPRGRHGVGLAETDPVLGVWPTLLTAWLASLDFGPAPAPPAATT